MKDDRYRIARGITVEEVPEKEIPNANKPGQLTTPVCAICSKPVEKKGFIQSNFGVIDMRNPAIFDMLCGSPHIGECLNKWEATPPEEISYTISIFHFNCFLQKCIDIANSLTKSEDV